LLGITENASSFLTLLYAATYEAYEAAVNKIFAGPRSVGTA